MTEFKAGDRVRYKSERHIRPTNKAGVGTIVRRGGTSVRDYWVVEQDGGIDVGYFGHEMTLIEPEPKFKTGDRVRVTVEADFYQEDDTYLGLDGVAVLKDVGDVDILSVEKVEPPVETFKPGDRVRHLVTKNEYTLGHGGVFSHQQHKWWEKGDDYLEGQFTSTYYEKVNLVEPPL